MSKWVLGALLVLAIIAVYILVGQGLLLKKNTTEAQAVEFATSELNYRYPGASIAIYDVKNTSTTPGESNWLLKSKVVHGPATLCPNLTIVEMDQKFNFVPRERLITENCSVLGCRGIQYCIIAYPEEAILMPLDPERNPSTRTAVTAYASGAPEGTAPEAQARHADTLYTPTNNTYFDVWVVDYSYPNATQSFEVVLNRTGGTAIESYYRKN